MVARTAAKKPEVEGSEDSSAAAMFRWEPKGGGDPIVFPKAVTVFKKGEVFKFFFQLHKKKNNQYDQIIFMMESADVPEDVQERVASLPDDEVLQLISAWTNEMRTTPGES